MKNNKILLLLVILALAIRFLGIFNLPPALNRDEAAIGYNAYSILKTGKDEHGQSWPLSFQSIGDYKMPLYIYATVLPVKLFGLNELAIRFWSAFAGISTVILGYLIVLRLAKDKKTALITAAFFAFNPWSVFYSRIGFEANLALAFFLTGFYFINQGLKKLPGFIFGLGFFVLSLLTYSSSLIFIPLFFLLWLLLHRPRLTAVHWLSVAGFIAITVIIIMALMPVSSQKSNITIFSDPATIDYYHQTRTAVAAANPLLAKTWWNQYIFFARYFFSNYVKTFFPSFLLLKGGQHPWHQIPHMGYFTFVEIFLAIIGLYSLFKSRRPLTYILLGWLLLAPITSAITIDAPHATRSLYLLPVIIILAAFGFNTILKTNQLKHWLIKLLVGLYLINLLYFGYQYVFNYPKNIATFLPVGLKQAITFVNNNYPHQPVYLFNIQDSSYLYPLIYTSFDPRLFQQTAIWTPKDAAGLTNAYQFDRFAIVNSSKDIQSPAIVIAPQGTSFTGPNLNPLFFNGHYLVGLF